MELRQYLRIILKSWWFIIPLTLIALTASLVFSYATTPIYRATSSYVTGLAPDVGSSSDAVIYGLDTLAGMQSMFSTYCGVMNSHNVRQDAYRLMGVTDPVALGLDKYVVQCNVMPESNILLLIVEGPAPSLVTRLNEAVGLAGMAQANRLYRPFPVERLDPVVLEPEPVSPNYTQNAVLGAVLGLVLGVTLAFVVEYLRSPLDRLEGLTIRHPKLGVYNERYFLRRFEEEIKRARVRNRPISLAFTQLIPDEDFNLLEESVQDGLLRQAALFLQDSLREGDIVAYFERQVFGLLFAETPGDEARAMLVNMHYDIRSRTFRFEEFSASFEAKSGLVESSGGVLGTQAMIDKAAEALRDAELAGENAIQLIRTSPAPFIQGDASAAAAPPLSFDASPLDDTYETTWGGGKESPVFGSEPPESRESN